jgi:transposase-like protein
MSDEPWKPATCQCAKCKSTDVLVQIVTSACGGYEDDHYLCQSCGHSWWVDGPDA